jgi:hypothetical protein
MTIDQIVRETHQWPPSQVEALVKALTNGSKAAEAPQLASSVDPVSRIYEFSKKIDSLWAGTNVDISTEEMIASLRESRSRCE